MRQPRTLRQVLHAAAMMSVTAMVVTALGGCSGGDGRDLSAETDLSQGTTPSPSASASADTPSNAPEETATAVSATTPIVIDVEGQEIAGELDDSAASASLLAQLPLTLLFGDYGSVEKFAELPEPLDLTGAAEGSAAEPLTIGYYVPDQRLILYYDHVGYFSGIVPIGSYEDAGNLGNQAGDFTATIRPAN